MRIVDPKGFASGLMFLAAGMTGTGIAAGYRIGTARALGPGYFPVLIGLLLSVLGLVVVIRSLSTGEEGTFPQLRLRGIGAVVLSFSTSGSRCTTWVFSSPSPAW